MIVALSTVLDAPFERVWAEVNRPALLRYVAAPLVAFRPLDPAVFPERWVEGTCRVGARLLGVLPMGWQEIRLSHPAPDGEARHLRDDGRGALARRWDHLITVAPEGPGRTRYTDRVEVEAGWLTPAVWAFARLFYAHRQRRWRALVARGFRYSAAATPSDAPAP